MSHVVLTNWLKRICVGRRKHRLSKSRNAFRQKGDSSMTKGIFKTLTKTLALTSISLVVTLAIYSCSAITSTSSSESPVVNTTTSTQQNQATDLPDIVAVVAKVKPSVVAINDQVTSTTFFGGTTTQAAAGSGWILDSNGLIVTNDHVVSGAENIVVSLNDGRIFKAVKVTSDPVNDLAIIQVDATALPAASIGDSSRLQVGMQVIAIGNALGEGVRVTGGLVSNLGTSISLSASQKLYDLIETDAAINPGNSGGPLVNMAGEVIGIVNAKVSASGVEGMGYAISSNTAIPILQQLRSQGHVVQPWIGTVFQTVDPGVAMVYGLSAQEGALIIDVAANSPGSTVGLQQGDVVLTINGKKVITATQAANAVLGSQIGQKLEITYQRDTDKFTTSVTTTQNPTQ
jgi:serine protease Do